MNADTEPDQVVFVYPTHIGVYRRKSAVPKTSRNGTLLTDCGIENPGTGLLMPGKLYYTIEQTFSIIVLTNRSATTATTRYTLQGIHGPSSCNEECWTHPSSEVRVVFFELF
jgi:hypothetical protein